MQILPKELIDVSIEPYANRIRVKSQLIYILVLLILMLAIASLPWLYVDVSISGSGIIRSEIPRAEIYAPVSGRVKKSYVQDNVQVAEGQSLLSILPDLLIQKEKSTSERINYFQKQLKDIDQYIITLKNDGSSSPIFVSPFYTSVLASHNEVIKKLNLNIDAEQKKYDRNKILYDQKVISKAEFEALENTYNSLLAEKEIEIQSQISSREGEKKQLEEQVDQLNSTLREIDKEKERYLVKAPVEGTVINMMKIRDGSFISVNQLIGEISPNSEVIAECYIPPADIGLLKEGQPIRFTVDAFNYNEWGFLEGEIREIAQDINFSNDGSNPYFIIKCKLHKEFLSLKSGMEGHLKKGMTVQGRFFVARRSLFQLLFDKTDDWINPSKN